MNPILKVDKNTYHSQPFYIKATVLLVGFYLLISMLSIAQDIIVPIIFAVMIAVLLHPFVNFFERLKINRVVAIIFTLFLTFMITFAIAFLIFRQLSEFGKSWPILVDKFTLMLNESTKWISRYFDLSQWKVQQWILKAKTDALSFSNDQVGQTLFVLGNWIVVMLLVPVYVFILLFYKKLLIEFIHRAFVSQDQKQVSRIISETKTVIHKYLTGLIIEAFIVAGLNITVLLFLGIEYPILLGILGALLNVIPYIGGLVAVALPMMVALATKTTSLYALYVLIFYYIIQLIDNNVIVPLIVSSKVKINALFAIIVVIAGNALWGVSGMFLSIPLLAVIKVIFDHIDSLKPWGFLLGDSLPDKPLDVLPVIKKIKAKILK
ncbi:AI-2E family transporter [Polaribacter glomeratus]|uniref:AI-2E family transporter n=1 Tax=Polaribacter glomeratus TaxID=102 RepID=A0A2S7WUW6_9FLAO|nr:AI-2E family transporter [Polaribacter glomeratus]PQJ81266.1 AI-2E family transporter [Polaribacter glomeratus]TXD65822.1 AI-2E family transporter [Polaribacter glomeratus]